MKARSTHTSDRTRIAWTFAITSIALFMTTLDNLVVTTALPVIRHDLHASLQGLEWTVNAYTLTFAVLLLTGAALGDRFGRKRLLVIGLSVFSAASAAAALAPNIEALVAARVVQGAAGAVVMPLTLTILSAAVPKEKRGMALGAWSGIAGLAVAIGPVVGGAIVDGISWQWIFWLNVPIGVVLVPLALRKLDESYGGGGTLDLKGLALALFRNRTFATANAATFLMYVGFFGVVFLLTQYWQFAHGYSPLGAGLRLLPWTVLPIFVAPLAGMLSARIGERPLLI